MLVYFFRPYSRALAIRKLKDLRNRHFCALWLGTEADVKALEVLARVRGRE